MLAFHAAQKNEHFIQENLERAVTMAVCMWVRAVSG